MKQIHPCSLATAFPSLFCPKEIVQRTVKLVPVIHDSHYCHLLSHLDMQFGSLNWKQCKVLLYKCSVVLACEPMQQT